MTRKARRKDYPMPPIIGDPPDAIREWAEKVIASWDLTTREREVADLVLQGFSTPEIAEMTGITDKTLKNHINTIFKKAHVGSRAELFSTILWL